MKTKIKGHLDKINPIMHLCNHLFADKHTHKHRILAGVFIMPVGVWTAGLFHWNPLLHFFADVVGYFIHGIGAVPIIDYAICYAKNEEQKVVSND